MKKIYLLVIAFVVTTSVFAQARNATAQYQGSKQPAIEFDVPFPEKTVNKSIDNYFENKGYKGKDASGYLTYKGVRLPELGPDYYDLYFKTDKKSRKEKDATTVMMLISAGYGKFIGDTTDANVFNNAKTYLNGLTERVAGYDLEQQIGAQNEVVKKVSKDSLMLSTSAGELQKKKTKIETDIEENLKTQATLKAELDKQLLILQTLKDKRKQ